MTEAVTIYGIKNCDTMKKARAWLDDARSLFTKVGKKDADVDEDLAWNAALLAETLLLTDPDAALRSAQEAERCLARLDDAKSADRDFTRAVVAGLQGHSIEAAQALRDALAHQGISFARYEGHLKLALACVADDESLRKALDTARASALSAAK